MAASFDCPLEELKEYEEIKNSLATGRGPLLISGCVDSQKVHLACRLAESSPLSLIVTYNDSRAKEICEDARCFSDAVFFYPAKDLLFYQADIHGNLLVQQRMAVWKQMLEEGRGIIVTTVDGCMDRIADAKELKQRILSLEVVQQRDLTRFGKKLAEMGYEREAQV